MINNNWVFGHGAGINFNNGLSTFSASVNGTVSMSTNEGCASVSDANGNLYFYTDGVSIWDGTHNQVIASLGISGHTSATQSSIIVPDPAGNNRYYIFTVGGADDRTSPDYSISKLMAVKVWQELNGDWKSEPVGFVNQYENTMPDEMVRGFTERVTAVQFPDCSGAWVMTTIRTSITNLIGTSSVPSTLTTNVIEGKYNYGDFAGEGMIRIFRVDSQGVTHHVDHPLMLKENPIMISHHGYLRVSRDKKRVAFANGLLENVVLLDFDASTGALSNEQVMQLDRTMIEKSRGGVSKDYDLIVYGLEFSADSSILYLTAITHHNDNGIQTTYGDGGTVAGYIIGMNLQLNVPVQTMIIAEGPGRQGHYTFGALQIGPDNVIYVARDMETAIGAIIDSNNLNHAAYVAGAVFLPSGTSCRLGLPNLLPNPCPAGDCDCGCSGCDENADDLNAELLKRAEAKEFDVKADEKSPEPWGDRRCDRYLQNDRPITPFFYLHWGDGKNDQIEEHDTEVFYITVANPYSDLEFKGLRITKITVVPDIHPLDKIQVVPDRFVHFDCIHPCSQASREFAMITRANDTAGSYHLEVEYCIDQVVVTSQTMSGKVALPFEITED